MGYRENTTDIDIEEKIVLEDNEFLFKLRQSLSEFNDGYPTGFLTKMTQAGTFPKKFLDWGNDYFHTDHMPISIVEETYKEGWKLISTRIGDSQTILLLVKHLL